MNFYKVFQILIVTQKWGRSLIRRMQINILVFLFVILCICEWYKFIVIIKVYLSILKF